MSEAGLPSISNSSSGLYERSHASTIARWAGFVLRSPAGTWWARNEPSTFLPSTSFGPVQPFGVRSTIIGQAGFSSVVPERAWPWIRPISSQASSNAAAIWTSTPSSSPETSSGLQP